jgi:aminopeptidase N
MKMRIALLTATAVVSACSSPNSRPEIERGRDTVDAALPTQLPRTAVPNHYTIEITPHAEALTFDGKVAIDLKVIKATRELVLNAADLEIANATLTPKGAEPMIGKTTVDADAQTATFTFERDLMPGDYRLDIAYSGKINTQANGLFALDYTNVDGKPARSLFTQFEAADARRFVPSWDEPDYKAVFDLKANVPAGEMAVSNMPAASSKDIGDGRKAVAFETSPVMSSYLLFFALGDFERITTNAGGREVGIVMSRGNGEKARYALDAEAQILPYYNDYFGRPYPLPKLDNVAGPGQSQFFSAMENWGAIFTFEKRLLLDPAISSEADKQAIFSIEAHEMAHMWFGDLVTMAWWDDLWLNEGFASWMANKTTQHFHPDWGGDIDQLADRESAMELDAFSTTHPVVQTIRTVEQANQAFDDITYEKGQSVISMLEGFAGAATWREGIRKYIAKLAYQNSRTGDLWAAIEGAGAKGLIAVARDFTTQPGIPLVQLSNAQCIDGQTVAPVTLGQFSNDHRQQAAAAPLSWHIPLRAAAGGRSSSLQVTTGHKATLRAPGCGVLLVNPGQTGYFRVLYTPEQAEALRRAFAQLSPADQYGVLSDSLALSYSGYQPMSGPLGLLAAIPASAHVKVAQKGVGSWRKLFRDLDGNPAAQAAISAYASHSYWPRLQQLGFAPREGESPLDALLRATLIKDLGELGEPHVVAEGRRLLGELQRNPNAIPGSLKESWLGVIAANADSSSWEILHRMAAGARGSIERSIYYGLLGQARNEALARRALELSITKEPGATVSAGMITSAAENHPSLALEFVLSHLAQVAPLIDLSSSSRYVARLVEESADPTLIPKLRNYAAAHIKPEDRRPVDHAVARIQWKADNRPRIEREVVQWLHAHPAGS